MNTFQVVQQIKYLLVNRLWEGTGEKVFGSVFISVRPNEDVYEHSMFPVAIIRPMGATIDPEHEEEHEYLAQEIDVIVAQAVAGDGYGEAPIIGANRSSTTSSGGRGLLEIEEEVFDSITLANGIDGIEILLRQKSAIDAAIDDEIGYVVFRGYRFEALTTSNRFYHPPTRLSATAAGGGSVNLAWKLPPARFDRYRVILRRAAGGTPPATAVSGTGVTLGGDLATSVTDSPGAGTFSYSIFGAYDELSAPPDSDDFFSAAESIAGVIVT